MKKRKRINLIYIFGIIFIIILISINYFIKPNEQIYEELLRRDYNKIFDLLKSSKKYSGKYLIDYKIIKGNHLNNKIDIESHSEIYKVNKKDLYGYLIYKNKCYKFDQFGNHEFLDSKQCTEITEPQDMLTIMSTTNSNNIKQDSEETGINITDDYGSKYYFIGENPDNYIIFSNKCFRIVNVSKNGNTKIIFENNMNKDTNNCVNVASNDSGNVGLVPWDRNKKVINDWNDTSLKRIMDDWLRTGKIDMGIYDFKMDMEYLEDVYWNIGLVDDDNKNILDIIEDEKSLKTKDKSKIGLISVSDYAKVNCRSIGVTDSSCGQNNYLYKEKYNWWTINNGSNVEKKAWIIEKDGTMVNKLIPFSHEYYFSGIRPVFYLKSNIKYIGTGSEKNPYKIVNS